MAIAVEPELEGPEVEREKAKLENAVIERKLMADRDKLEKRGRFFGSLSSACLLYTSPSPRDATLSRMPSSA